ncbi:hypothetical protein [Caulobacter sp. AP07]|uniref:hypothetical protein n=1 Tax=Caulobacter sp. AP07 TaxID=1144304 RepID=UPI00054FF787|nr:hypothetical protein [Caulobacter sp. AP07]
MTHDHTSLKSVLAAAGAACALLCAASGAQAQARPQIKYQPAATAPAVPDGLKVFCAKTPDDLNGSKTCPVIYYGGFATWIYSFIDNRFSFAVVSYDAKGNVVQNLTRDGARYVFDVTSSDAGQTVILHGQANRHVELRWSELPQPPVAAAQP